METENGTQIIKPTNTTLQSSGEVWSVLWNTEMKVRHVKVGYPINSFRGNNCGFGAAFALQCALGTSYTWLRAQFEIMWHTHPARVRWPMKLPAWWAEYCQGPQC